MLKKSGLLTLHRGGETFADLGGLAALKSFCSRALRPGRPAGVRARGVLLLGPPGSGKSAFCKALGDETGPADPDPRRRRPARLARRASRRPTSARRCKLVDAMAPCVVMIDEVEKALAGASGPAGDSGVSARMFGAFLTWLNDHESDAFVVCTANDVSQLPPEFCAFRAVRRHVLPRPARAGRAAGDLADVPGAVSASTPTSRVPTTATGPGPRSSRAAAWRRCWTCPWSRPRSNIVPVAVTAGESVERLRPWAAGRCLAADRAGLYTRATEPAGKPGRAVRRDPSAN